MTRQQQHRDTTILAAILFADVSGFSNLDAPQLQAYATRLVPDLNELVHQYQNHLIEVNTWGDGFFFLSRQAQGLAELALDLRDFFRKCKWGLYQLPELKIRIALHSAEVFLYQNQIKGRGASSIAGCIGTQVNMTARIEPITPPNHIWTTAVFKDIVVGHGPHPPKHLCFDHIGPYPLAKNAGEIDIWHLKRAGFDSASPRPPKPITVIPLPANENEKVVMYSHIHERIAKCGNGEEVRMIAITGRNVLVPPPTIDENFDRKPIPMAIKRGVRFRVVVLHPESDESLFRSGVESGTNIAPLNRLLQKDAHEVAESLVETYSRELHVSEKQLKQRLHIRRTSIGIGFSLWLFSDIAFLELHHFGKEEGNRNLCHFAKLIVPQGTREYDLLDKHFATMWDANQTKALW